MKWGKLSSNSRVCPGQSWMSKAGAKKVDEELDRRKAVRDRLALQGGTGDFP